MALNPAPVSQLLSSNGDGTGTTNAVGDYSVTPLDLDITCPAGQELQVIRVIFTIEDAGTFDADKYGALVGGLTNGWTLEVYDGVATDVTLASAVKTNGNIASICHDTIDHGLGTNTHVTARWTFDKFIPGGIILQPGESLRWTHNDDMTGIVTHQCLAQGHTLDRSAALSPNL